MDKIKARYISPGDCARKEITIEETLDKINELIEGYNEIMKELRDMTARQHSKEIEDIIINDK